MAETLLSVSGLVKEYPAPGAALRVLDGVSFELGRGESLVVTGPSGSGKSTLLNVIGTLDTPTAGEVVFRGEAVHGFDPDRAAGFRNREIGFVFQDHHLLPQLTALENVILPALAGGRVRAETQARAAELLEAVGLGRRAQHFPSEMSGGERQRAAIARALVNGPALVLADEPTGDLDAHTARGIARLLLSLRETAGAGPRRESCALTAGVALVVVTHNAEFGAMFDRRAELRGGKLHE